MNHQSIFSKEMADLEPLTQAQQIQSKCAEVGFDWHTLGPVVDKVREEVDEVMQEALNVVPQKDKIEEELGDLLFAVVNLVRHLDCDAHSALTKANQKFIRRFAQVEAIIQAQNKSLSDCSLQQLDDAWELVKASEGKSEK